MQQRFRRGDSMTGVRYQFACMNAMIDGVIVNDFVSDAEAVEFAANYEARCYRIEPDGTRTLIFQPGQDE